MTEIKPVHTMDSIVPRWKVGRTDIKLLSAIRFAATYLASRNDLLFYQSADSAAFSFFLVVRSVFSELQEEGDL